MYYGSGTVYRIARWQLADAAAYAPGRRCACTHQMVALFCVKWRHGRHLESVTSNQISFYSPVHMTNCFCISYHRFQLSCVIGLIVGGALNTHVELELEWIDAYSLEEQACQISFKSGLKWESFRLYWRASQQQQQQQQQQQDDY